MLERLQQMAFKSPFQLTDLGSTAKQLIARGIDPNQVVRRTGQIGDIAVTNPATGNIETVLNATGDEKIRQVIDGITSMFDTVAKFVTSSLVKDLASYSWDTLIFGIKEMFSNLEEIATYYQDIFVNHDFGKLLSDMQHYSVGDGPGYSSHVDQSPAVQAAQDKLNSLVTAGASDEAINRAKQDLLDAEKSQKGGSGKSITNTRTQRDIPASTAQITISWGTDTVSGLVMGFNKVPVLHLASGFAYDSPMAPPSFAK